MPLGKKGDAVWEWIREIANERHQFDNRWLAILIRCEGKAMNLKKVYRLYRDEQLPVCKRSGRKQALGTRAPIAILRTSITSGLGFVSDALTCGQRFRVLNGMDDYNQECLACIVDTSLSGC